MSTAEPKTLLTVPEAAAALRIGRSTAYDLAHAWLESGGTKGLPVVVIGGSLRVPVAAIDRLFALGGFGAAWQSGLDRRRSSRKSSSIRPAGVVSPVPAPMAGRSGVPKSEAVAGSDASGGISDAGPVPMASTKASLTDAELRQLKSHRARPVQRGSQQLSLFDEPDA